MINPQTARLLTLGLGTTRGVLLLLAGAQQLGVGRATAGLLPGGTAPTSCLRSLRSRAKPPPWGPPRSTPVSARPCSTRIVKPTPPDAADGDKAGDPQVPLNVTLTGVIITRR